EGGMVRRAIGDLPISRGIVAFPNDGDAIPSRLQMPIDAIGRHIERPVLIPLDGQIVGRIGGVLDLGKGFDPVEALSHLSPEHVGFLNRALIHGLVLRIVDKGPARPFRWYAVDLVRHWPLSSHQAPGIVLYYRHTTGMINRSLVEGGDLHKAPRKGRHPR